MLRTADDFHRVKQLSASGLSDYQVARLTAVPRGTVLRWRRRDTPPRVSFVPVDAEDWQVQDVPSYVYLLGCYLGDGHLTLKPPRCWTLRIACDRLYPQIIHEIHAAMSATFPERRSSQIHASSGASEVVSICHPAIGRAFPQHGPGRKHLRRIRLTAWQRQLTSEHPEALIRGLIHSDGCRVVNRFKTKLPSGRVAEYAYVRYFFSNLSADIREIFIEHCRLLGIRVTQSNHRNLTVSHRHSVAKLERFVGPKT